MSLLLKWLHHSLSTTGFMFYRMKYRLFPITKKNCLLSEGIFTQIMHKINELASFLICISYNYILKLLFSFLTLFRSIQSLFCHQWLCRLWKKEMTTWFLLWTKKKAKWDTHAQFSIVFKKNPDTIARRKRVMPRITLNSFLWLCAHQIKFIY